MLKIELGGNFKKMSDELLEVDSELKTLISEKITLFKRKPVDTRLRNHPLSGKMVGQFAFSITDDIRIIYKFTGKNTVRFLAIGPHEKVYSK